MGGYARGAEKQCAPAALESRLGAASQLHPSAAAAWAPLQLGARGGEARAFVLHRFSFQSFGGCAYAAWQDLLPRNSGG